MNLSLMISSLLQIKDRHRQPAPTRSQMIDLRFAGEKMAAGRISGGAQAQPQAHLSAAKAVVKCTVCLCSTRGAMHGSWREMGCPCATMRPRDREESGGGGHWPGSSKARAKWVRGRCTNRSAHRRPPLRLRARAA